MFRLGTAVHKVTCQEAPVFLFKRATSNFHHCFKTVVCETLVVFFCISFCISDKPINHMTYRSVDVLLHVHEPPFGMGLTKLKCDAGMLSKRFLRVWFMRCDE